MTIHADLTGKKQRADVFTYGGVAVAIVFGVLAGFTSPWLFLICLAGAITAVAASLWRLHGIRCPRCRRGIGYVISYSVSPFAAPSDIRFCPYCGTSFDAPLDATPTI